MEEEAGGGGWGRLLARRLRTGDGDAESSVADPGGRQGGGGAWKESELEPRRVSRCTCSSQSQRAVSLAVTIPVTVAVTTAATIAVTSVMYLAPG